MGTPAGSGRVARNRQCLPEETIECLPSFLREPDIGAGDGGGGLCLPHTPAGKLHARPESLVSGGPSLDRRLPYAGDMKLELTDDGACRGGVNGREARVVRSVEQPKRGEESMLPVVRALAQSSGIPIHADS